MLVTEVLGAVASSPHGRSGLLGVRGSPLPQGLKQCHLGVRWGLSRLSWQGTSKQREVHGGQARLVRVDPARSPEHPPDPRG